MLLEKRVRRLCGENKLRPIVDVLTFDLILDSLRKVVKPKLLETIAEHRQQYCYGRQSLLPVHDSITLTTIFECHHRTDEVAFGFLSDDVVPEILDVLAGPRIRALETRDSVIARREKIPDV